MIGVFDMRPLYVTKEDGLVECRTGVQDVSAQNQTTDRKKQDTSKMEKMAILIELDKPNTFQQREVSAAPQFQMSAGSGCRG